jgi:hypothetical protein
MPFLILFNYLGDNISSNIVALEGEVSQPVIVTTWNIEN